MIKATQLLDDVLASRITFCLDFAITKFWEEEELAAQRFYEAS
jgi:hypothetical protein